MKTRPELITRSGKSNVLKNLLTNLRENDLHYENNKITQCVFLGVLKLKPVPSAFSSNKVPTSNSFAINDNSKKVKKHPVRTTNNSYTKNNINKVISGKISKKNPEKIKAFVKKVPPKKSHIIKVKFKMNKKSTSLENVPNVPESITNLTDTHNQSKIVTTSTKMQYNPIQHLFDKMKGKMDNSCDEKISIKEEEIFLDKFVDDNSGNKSSFTGNDKKSKSPKNKAFVCEKNYNSPENTSVTKIHSKISHFTNESPDRIKELFAENNPTDNIVIIDRDLSPIKQKERSSPRFRRISIMEGNKSRKNKEKTSFSKNLSPKQLLVTEQEMIKGSANPKSEIIVIDDTTHFSQKCTSDDDIICLGEIRDVKKTLSTNQLSPLSDCIEVIDKSNDHFSKDNSYLKNKSRSNMTSNKNQEFLHKSLRNQQDKEDDEVIIISTLISESSQEQISPNPHLGISINEVQESTCEITAVEKATQKTKSKRSRLIPAPIPSIFLQTPRLLRSELSQKKLKKDYEKPLEKQSRSKSSAKLYKSSNVSILNKSEIISTKNLDKPVSIVPTSSFSPKKHKNRQINDNILDEDTIFVSEEIKSPNQEGKPSLKLIIRQKKKTDIPNTEIQQINRDDPNTSQGSRNSLSAKIKSKGSPKKLCDIGVNTKISPKQKNERMHVVYENLIGNFNKKVSNNLNSSSEEDNQSESVKKLIQDLTDDDVLEIPLDSNKTLHKSNPEISNLVSFEKNNIQVPVIDIDLEYQSDENKSFSKTKSNNNSDLVHIVNDDNQKLPKRPRLLRSNKCKEFKKNDDMGNQKSEFISEKIENNLHSLGEEVNTYSADIGDNNIIETYTAAIKSFKTDGNKSLGVSPDIITIDDNCSDIQADHTKTRALWSTKNYNAVYKALDDANSTNMNHRLSIDNDKVVININDDEENMFSSENKPTQSEIITIKDDDEEIVQISPSRILRSNNKPISDIQKETGNIPQKALSEKLCQQSITEKNTEVTLSNEEILASSNDTNSSIKLKINTTSKNSNKSYSQSSSISNKAIRNVQKDKELQSSRCLRSKKKSDLSNTGTITTEVVSKFENDHTAISTEDNSEIVLTIEETPYKNGKAKIAVKKTDISSEIFNIRHDDSEIQKEHSNSATLSEEIDNNCLQSIEKTSDLQILEKTNNPLTKKVSLNFTSETTEDEETNNKTQCSIVKEVLSQLPTVKENSTIQKDKNKQNIIKKSKNTSTRLLRSRVSKPEIENKLISEKNDQQNNFSISDVSTPLLNDGDESVKLFKKEMSSEIPENVSPTIKKKNQNRKSKKVIKLPSLRSHKKNVEKTEEILGNNSKLNQISSRKSYKNEHNENIPADKKNNEITLHENLIRDFPSSKKVLKSHTKSTKKKGHKENKKLSIVAKSKKQFKQKIKTNVIRGAKKTVININLEEKECEEKSLPEKSLEHLNEETEQCSKNTKPKVKRLKKVISTRLVNRKCENKYNTAKLSKITKYFRKSGKSLLKSDKKEETLMNPEMENSKKEINLVKPNTNKINENVGQNSSSKKQNSGFLAKNMTLAGIKLKKDKSALKKKKKGVNSLSKISKKNKQKNQSSDSLDSLQIAEIVNSIKAIDISEEKKYEGGAVIISKSSIDPIDSENDNFQKNDTSWIDLGPQLKKKRGRPKKLDGIKSVKSSETKSLKQKCDKVSITQLKTPTKNKTYKEISKKIRKTKTSTSKSKRDSGSTTLENTESVIAENSNIVVESGLDVNINKQKDKERITNIELESRIQTEDSESVICQKNDSSWIDLSPPLKKQRGRPKKLYDKQSKESSENKLLKRKHEQISVTQLKTPVKNKLYEEIPKKTRKLTTSTPKNNEDSNSTILESIESVIARNCYSNSKKDTTVFDFDEDDSEEPIQLQFKTKQSKNKDMKTGTKPLLQTKNSKTVKEIESNIPQKMSPLKSPMKQATIMEMFEKITKEQKQNLTKPLFENNEKMEAGTIIQSNSDEIFEAETDKNNSKVDTTQMRPPPSKQTKNEEYDDEDDFSDDDSRAEWMPEEYAEYKFKYSAKKLKPQIFKCKICLLILPSYPKLLKHKNIHVNAANPYECKQCKETFKNVDDLVAHLKIHKGEHPYKCTKCNEGFWTKEDYNKHLPIHILRKVKEAPKKYQCDLCGKAFVKLCDMDRHTRVHTGEKPSVCNICGKGFQQSHNLSKHLITHLHIKPFACEICSKQFNRPDVLARHVLTHAVEKPFKCSFCPKSFIRQIQLNMHIKHEHTNKTKNKESNNTNKEHSNSIQSNETPKKGVRKKIKSENAEEKQTVE